MAKLWRGAKGTFFRPTNFDGPNAVGIGPMEDNERTVVGRILARYGKSQNVDQKQIAFDGIASHGEFSVSRPMEEEDLIPLRL